MEDEANDVKRETIWDKYTLLVDKILIILAVTFSVYFMLDIFEHESVFDIFSKRNNLILFFGFLIISLLVVNFLRKLIYILLPVVFAFSILETSLYGETMEDVKQLRVKDEKYDSLERVNRTIQSDFQKIKLKLDSMNAVLRQMDSEVVSR
jgi:TRAP-type uncharacterized transport system fused permease subunit